MNKNENEVDQDPDYFDVDSLVIKKGQNSKRQGEDNEENPYFFDIRKSVHPISSLTSDRRY